MIIHFIPMTYDFMFKHVLRNNPDYTNLLIHYITGIPLEILKHALYNDPSIMDENFKEKHQIADLIISVDNMTINLEMNHVAETYKSKNLSYAIGLYRNKLLSGKSYDDAEQIIQINFNSFNTKTDTEIINLYLLTHQENHQVLSEMLKLYHVNLEKLKDRKYTKNINPELVELLNIMNLKTLSELDKLKESNNSVIEKVVNTMEEYSKSNEALGLYNLEEERERIQNTIVNHAVKKAIDENTKKVREETCKEVSIKLKTEFAQKMLKKHMPISEIIDCTGLSEEEINKLSK